MPSYGEGKKLTEAALQELYDAPDSCTGCRRCMVYCPFSIDTQLLMSIAKLLLVGAHAEPEILMLLANTFIRTIFERWRPIHVTISAAAGAVWWP